MGRTLVLLLAVSLAGCYCWKPENVKKPECIVLRNTIDCTKGGVQEQIGHFAPILAWILSGGSANTDWSAMLDTLINMGIDIVGCTAEQLVNAFITKQGEVEKSMAEAANMSGAPDLRTKYEVLKTKTTLISNNWREYKAKKFPAYKFVSPDKLHPDVLNLVNKFVEEVK